MIATTEKQVALMAVNEKYGVIIPYKVTDYHIIDYRTRDNLNYEQLFWNWFGIGTESHTEPADAECACNTSVKCHTDQDVGVNRDTTAYKSWMVDHHL